MITFQAIIDEARKQKEVIVQGFYESIKKDYRDYSYYNVIAALDGGEGKPFSFYVSNEVENAYHTEPNAKLFTVSLDDDNIEEKENPSKEQLAIIFDEQLAWLEKLANKEIVTERVASMNSNKVNKEIIHLTKNYLSQLTEHQSYLSQNRYLFYSFNEIIKLLKIAIEIVERKLNRL